MTYDGHRLAIPSNAEYSVPQLDTRFGRLTALMVAVLPGLVAGTGGLWLQ